MSSDSPEWVYTSRRPRSTSALGEKLGRLVAPGTVIGLVGDLGMGKTRFVQGFARGMGVSDMGEVSSPTYTLANEYPAQRGMVVHIDFYRLNVEESARALGLEEQLARRDAVIVVEWADHIPTLMPANTVFLRFERLGVSEREIRITGLPCPKGLRLVQRIK